MNLARKEKYERGKRETDPRGEKEMKEEEKQRKEKEGQKRRD
jgi:hypothetical protein